jgi:hypothetical protein
VGRRRRPPWNADDQAADAERLFARDGAALTAADDHLVHVGERVPRAASVRPIALERDEELRFEVKGLDAILVGRRVVVSTAS